MRGLRIACVAGLIALLVASVPASAQTVSPCPSGSVTSATFNTPATVHQEDAITLTGMVTTNQASACLAIFVLSNQNNSTNPISQLTDTEGAPSGPYVSTDIAIGPGTTSFTAEVDQNPQNPMHAVSAVTVPVHIYSITTFGSPVDLLDSTVSLTVTAGEASKEGD